LLTAKLETFRAEDEAVLKAGLSSAYVTVDDTGARHAGKNGYTTQIGSDTFTVFRTGPSKSRQAFLSWLCGSTALYVTNDAAHCDDAPSTDFARTIVSMLYRVDAIGVKVRASAPYQYAHLHHPLLPLEQIPETEVSVRIHPMLLGAFRLSV
jgi:hypothetical protein